VAIALKIGIGDLLAELLAHAFDVLALAHAAGAVAALGLEALLDCLNDLFVLV